MVSRRRYAVLFLLIAGVALATPLLAIDACDDWCGDHCGDCASCPLVAEPHGPATSIRLVSALLPAAPDSGSQPERSRALDHVPLLRR